MSPKQISHSDFSKDELLALAEEHKVALTEGTKKEDIFNALVAAGVEFSFEDTPSEDPAPAEETPAPAPAPSAAPASAVKPVIIIPEGFGKFTYKKLSGAFEIINPNGTVHRVFTKQDHPDVDEQVVKDYVNKRNTVRVRKSIGL